MVPPSSSTNPSSQTQLGAVPPSNFSSEPAPHFDANAKIDAAQSTALTNYLHGAQLPLVGARVLANNGGPHQAILYGYVGTPFGKADASDKARQWLNDSKAQIDNRIAIEPDLVAPSSGSTTADNQNLGNPNAYDPNNPDIQKYEQEQNREQARQQQQYMNQGSGFGGTGMGMGFGTGGSGLTMFLPLLLGSGMSLGGGSGLFGGGGGMVGPMGSPYGAPYNSPYGSGPYGGGSYGGPYGGGSYGPAPYSSGPPPGGLFGP